MTVIGFVRHGNTDWNIEQRMQGHAHNPLNERGRQQAEAMGRRLAEEDWQLIFSSDLLRARQTAETIASYTRLPILYDQRLREIDRGRLEGTTQQDRIERWGPDWRKLDFGDETKEQLSARGVQFVRELLHNYAGQRVLVVTHGMLLTETLRALCPDSTDADSLVNNASITIVCQSNEQLGYLLYNCTRHLKIEECTR